MNDEDLAREEETIDESVVIHEDAPEFELSPTQFVDTESGFQDVEVDDA